MKISEIITDKYKLRIPPTVYYELLADIRNFEEPTTKDDVPENNVENIEPTTKNDLGVDCIDRNSIKYYSGHGGYMYASKGEIDKLPSITPQEPKTGHWIPVRVDRYSEQYGHFKINEYKCSNCNSEFEYGYHNYCPYCGAKMVEPQESEG